MYNILLHCMIRGEKDIRIYTNDKYPGIKLLAQGTKVNW